MVVALTARQWKALVEATGTAQAMAALETATGIDLDTETGRYEARDFIAAVLRRWFAQRSLAQVRATFAGTGVSWGPYQTFRQLVDEDERCSTANPMFDEVEHPGVGTYPMPRSPLNFGRHGRLPTRRAPMLGEHTEEIVLDELGLTDHELGDLLDRGIVRSAQRAETELHAA
jgi:2-methylfumaryl-CoA isomerase